MRTAPLLLAAVLGAAALAVSAQPAQPAPPPAGHPVIGKWQWTVRANNCTEVYDFRADGTAPVTSGAEKTDNTYTVSPQPDAAGFYRLVIRTTRDHGGKDCGDDTSDSTNQENTLYLLFEPSRTQHIVCAAPRLDDCYGPFRRMP
jgi:hypothetical protein